MQIFQEFYAGLSTLASDNDVMRALSSYFSQIGSVKHVERWNIENKFLDIGGMDKRTFIVHFKKPIDAINAKNTYKLRSFGFEAVVIELKRAS